VSCSCAQSGRLRTWYQIIRYVGGIGRCRQVYLGVVRANGDGSRGSGKDGAGGREESGSQHGDGCRVEWSGAGKDERMDGGGDGKKATKG